MLNDETSQNPKQEIIAAKNIGGKFCGGWATSQLDLKFGKLYMNGEWRTGATWKDRCSCALAVALVGSPYWMRDLEEHLVATPAEWPKHYLLIRCKL